MTGVSICLRKWKSESGRAQRLMRTDRFGIWAEEEEDTHHLRAPVAMETWPCSLWFSLLFLEGVSCTSQFIRRGLKGWRNRVASSHFIYCSLVSNMMRKGAKKVPKLFESTHTHTLTIFKQPCVCKIKSGRLVSTHEFSILLISGKKRTHFPSPSLGIPVCSHPVLLPGGSAQEYSEWFRGWKCDSWTQSRQHVGVWFMERVWLVVMRISRLARPCFLSPHPELINETAQLSAQSDSGQRENTSLNNTHTGADRSGNISC